MHSKSSHHPTEFGVNRHFVSEDIMALVCHVISQDRKDQMVMTVRVRANHSKSPSYQA